MWLTSDQWHKPDCYCRDDEVVIFLFRCVPQWFEEKFQEVDSEEQQLRKLHAVIDSLVNHRKGELQLSLYNYELLFKSPQQREDEITICC